MNTNHEAKTWVFALMYSLYRCEASRFAACTYDIMNTNYGFLSECIMKDIELAKNLLNNEKKTIVIVKDGKVVFLSKDKGIEPVYTAFNEFKDELQGSSAADKVIGKAAAMIYAYAGIKELSTNLISEKAVDVLKNTTIVYEYEKLVSYIKNRDRSGMCPIETLSLEVNNIDELLLKISNFLQKERTLVLIKPDAIERKLMGEIISVYEKNFQITDMRMIKPSVEIAEKHYYEHKDKPFFNELIAYITRGNVCALIIEGTNAIERVRRINGATDPKNAEPESIRGKLALSKQENSVHGSDSKESAEREIKIWFE